MNPSLRLSLTTIALTTTALAAPPANTTPSETTGRETPRAYTDSSTTYQVDSYPASSFHYTYDAMWARRMPFNSGISTTVTVRNQRIYLPPTPPALGEPTATAKPQTTLTEITLPPILRNYVYETFYAPLSALMYSEDLSRSRRHTLDTYLASRQQALAALRAKLDTLAGADADTRQRELSAFAPTQAAALAVLESTADSIRDNLVNGTWLQTGVDWNNLRHWRLGDDTRWESQLDEMKVIVGAAFFEEGLTTPQRLLLREMAMEMSDSLRPPDTDISFSAPGPYLYFSPFTARIRLPANLPSEVEAKIDAYRAKKSILKQQLRDALYQTDRAFWTSTRVNALKVLAVQQAPEFAAIEQLAEEIRIGLAPFPNPARPPALPLPAAVTKRLGAYITQKSEWQKLMVDKLNDLRTQLPDDRIEFSRFDGRPSIQLVSPRRPKADSTAKRAAIVAELVAFNTNQQRTYDALTKEKIQLSTEIFQIASNLAGRQAVKSIDQLVAEFNHSLGLQENWLRYETYETAVLQPGLSPEQRRLLFGAALDKLDLPLLNR